MSSESTSRQSKKVCFICGSYTTLAINIHEPRGGPNIVDVINQKFRVQPLGEDKFLCFSCNNWLINWHSLQNKNEASSSKAGKNKSLINQSIPEEHQQETMASLVSQYADVLQIRCRLQKYFYFPKKKIPKTSKYAKKRSIAKCSFCGKPIRQGYQRSNGVVNKRNLRFCHKCKQTIREYFDASAISSESLSQSTRPSIELCEKNGIFDQQHSSQLKIVSPYVVSRLERLGTTVVCEGASAATDNDLSHTYPTSITNRMKNRKKIDVTRSKPDEIVISFNTVLQEVFPVDLYHENIEDVVAMSVDEIYKRVPKSLSITLV